MNLKTQMQGIASVFDQKKYVYVVPADKPADISPLSIGAGKGILNAIVAPVGLPIITGIHQNSFGCENHVAGFVQLAPTVVKGSGYTGSSKIRRWQGCRKISPPMPGPCGVGRMGRWLRS